MSVGTLDDGLKEAEEKAFDSLARYKFMMFGYWAAIWVHLNRLEGKKRPSPFKAFVALARSSRVERTVPIFLILLSGGGA